MAYLVVVILKQIGARIIIAGLLFGAITRALASPNTLLEKYWPLTVFFCLIVGAGIGVLGFIQNVEKEVPVSDALECAILLAKIDRSARVGYSACFGLHC